MKISFEDKGLEELIFNGYSRKYKKLSKDKEFINALARVYTYMESVPNADLLKHYSRLHYEKLKHIGLSSVRILNGRIERLLFRELSEGIEIVLIELSEDHYGNKK